MLRRILIVFATVAILMFTGCSNVPNDTVNSNDPTAIGGNFTQNLNENSFADKILLLQSEMKKYSPNDKSLSPKRVNSISISCSNAFKDILSSKDSINSTEKDLLGAESNFYIKYGKEIVIGESKYRLVEFGNKSNADGTVTELLMQKYDDQTDLPVEVSDVLRITNTASGIEKIDYFDFINLDNSYNILVFSKFNGAEVNLVKLSGHKLENGKLSPNLLIDTNEAEGWEVDNTSNKGICNLYYKNAANDYQFSIDNMAAKVVALGNNGKVLGEIKFAFNRYNSIANSDTPKSLNESDFAIIDEKSKIELYKEFKDLKIEKQELKTENNFVGETKSDGFVYKYYMHQYDGFDLYVSNANYNFKGKKIDDRYISQITLKKESGFKTPRGINLGSTLNDIFEAYGQTTMKKENGNDIIEYQVNDMGLKFFIDTNQNVSSIIIYIIVKNAG